MRQGMSGREWFRGGAPRFAGALQVGAAAVGMLFGTVQAADLSTPLRTLAACPGFGAKTEAEGTAWREVADKAETGDLLVILSAMDGATPLGANYLRSAADFVFERSRAGGKPLPKGEFEAFVFSQHDPRARRTAYEWLTILDPTTPDRLLPKLLNDAGVELRRDAVARVLVEAEAALKADKKEPARELFKVALNSARDDDQVKSATAALRKLGETVDLPKHFGFVLDWKLIGPFDNKDKKGYAAVFPPETGLDFAAKYEGKDKLECVWKEAASKDEYGVVELNELLGKHKGSLCYAATEFVSDREQPVEIRLGCVTAWKLWLNGKQLFEREEYHRGFTIDQYRVPAVLRPGKNTLLLKVCQNEQTEDWAQRWQFQLRVCDATGTAILSTARPDIPTAPAKK